ncbi:hypothetical protein [Arthrobacter sp. 08Y14]|uniref:hypothetical protein n=1 Tax=Arthrobacter sp. 08Y14 TaxID=2058885 RepID=UPI000CE40F16|nr:hypothetical protein [Arthrobacter sp. 08Y14]
MDEHQLEKIARQATELIREDPAWWEIAAALSPLEVLSGLWTRQAGRGRVGTTRATERAAMSEMHKLSRNEAAEFLNKLLRDISAARLRVTLDGKLGRETPAPVKKLASLPDPPSIDMYGSDASPAGQAAASGQSTAAVDMRYPAAVMLVPADNDESAASSVKPRKSTAGSSSSRGHSVRRRVRR